MTFVNLVGGLEVLRQCVSAFGPHLCMSQIEGDESWDDTFDQFGRLRAEVVVGQVKDLQVEVSPALLYDFKVAQALCSDAAV